jgi:hypothetical protein
MALAPQIDRHSLLQVHGPEGNHDRNDISRNDRSDSCCALDSLRSTLGGCRRSRSFRNKPVMKIFFIILAAMLTATSAYAQDPQAVMDMLLKRGMQQYELSHQNQMMRLESERRELEEKLRLSSTSDRQVAEELARYCQNGEPPCWRRPPVILLDEAARRGLVQYSSPQPTTKAPVEDCMVIGLGQGDATIDCR